MRCANFVVKKPMVIGHECAGIIEEVGSQVKSLVVGDRVALEPGISCGECHLCKQGRYNLCPKKKFFGSPPTNGSLANQVVHPADLCYKLPDNVSLEEGAMCEPLSLGVHASRAFGAPTILIADVDDRCLSFAKSLGADQTIQVTPSIQDVEKEVEQIRQKSGGIVDVSFDCVGFNKTMATALQATSSGGKVCLIGLGQTEMTVPITAASARFLRSDPWNTENTAEFCMHAVEQQARNVVQYWGGLIVDSPKSTHYVVGGEDMRHGRRPISPSQQN
nr:L-idonate 5-dehydrogenase-like [Ipomoea batatas]